MKAKKLIIQGSQSAFESTAARKTLSLAESRQGIPEMYLTHCELTGFEETGTYAEMQRFTDRILSGSLYVRQIAIGKTAQERKLLILVVSKPRRTKFLTEASPKTTVLIQGAVHAGETAGKDAILLLLRDLLIKDAYPQLLERLKILFLPVLNPDGHEMRSRHNRPNQNGPREMGFRVNALGLNLNRDYLKCESPEMTAWVRAFTRWSPSVIVDQHTTNGADYQYDIAYSAHIEELIHPVLGRWTSHKLLPALHKSLSIGGHIIGPHLEIEDPDELKLGARVDPGTPGYCIGYAAIRNCIGLLIETHSLKCYKTQVWAHYDALYGALQCIAENLESLNRAIRRANNGLKPGSRKVLSVVPSTRGISYLFKGLKSEMMVGPLSGLEYRRYLNSPDEKRLTLYTGVRAQAVTRIPLAYVIPPEWKAVISCLEKHGLILERTKVDAAGVFETYELQNPRWDTQPSEGHLRCTFKSYLMKTLRKIPKGAAVVRLSQMGAAVAIHLLEPDATDCLARWGWFNTIFEQKEYMSDFLLVPFAEALLRDNEDIRREYKRKLKTDESFASTPEARKEFLFRRSAYSDETLNQYPIVRLRSGSQFVMLGLPAFKSFRR